MKKIFTCISLAAATFMATTPVMAQQQKQLTDKEKAAVVPSAAAGNVGMIRSAARNAAMPCFKCFI